MLQLTLRSQAREEFLSLTSQLQDQIAAQGWREGALVLYCPHTTAALTVNEDADPTVVRDMLTHLAGTIPRHGDYRHAEGNSDAHIKTSLLGPSLTLIVSDGRLQLGTPGRAFSSASLMGRGNAPCGCSGLGRPNRCIPVWCHRSAWTCISGEDREQLRAICSSLAPLLQQMGTGWPALSA